MKKQERKKKMIANAIADIAVADLANKGITATSPGSSIEDFDKTIKLNENNIKKIQKE